MSWAKCKCCGKQYSHAVFGSDKLCQSCEGYVKGLRMELDRHKVALDEACIELKSVTEDAICFGNCHGCGTCNIEYFLNKADNHE